MVSRRAQSRGRTDFAVMQVPTATHFVRNEVDTINFRFVSVGHSRVTNSLFKLPWERPSSEASIIRPVQGTVNIYSSLTECQRNPDRLAHTEQSYVFVDMSMDQWGLLRLHGLFCWGRGVPSS